MNQNEMKCHISPAWVIKKKKETVDHFMIHNEIIEFKDKAYRNPEKQQS